MTIRTTRVTATVATGDSGATATTELITGRILKVAINVTGDSMDINLDSTGEASAQAILNYTGNTDTTFYPRTPTVDADNAANSLYAATFPVYVPFVVHGKLTLTLANAAAAETVTAEITYEA